MKEECVAQLIDYFEDQDTIYIVQEYIDGIHLAKYIKMCSRSENAASLIFRSLARGLLYIHSMGVAHRDIKLENIMLEFKETYVTPKYIDFGLSKVLLRGEISTDRFGTMAYCSPEILVSGLHSHQTDIWSLGVVLFIMLSGNFPFLHPDKNQTKKNIVSGNVIFQKQPWEQVSRQARELVVKILTPNLFKRFTLEEIIRDPWLNN